MITVLNDLENGHKAFVEVVSGEIGKLRSLTYISDCGTDCPACGECDCLDRIGNDHKCDICGTDWLQIEA